MIKNVRLRIKPEEFADNTLLETKISETLDQPLNEWRIVRKSIDARQSQVWFDLEVMVAIGEDREISVPLPSQNYIKTTASSPQVIIVGAGPAGLFAALRALELGWRPIVVERGKPVEERLKDVVELQKNGILDPDSNFCFGEGGAGAFSDGKLFTRSKKRGNISEILAILHHHGAKKEILYEAHPHIGSDKLPKIIKAIRETIINNGGTIKFSTLFKELIIEKDKVKGIVTSDNEILTGPVILASGHSARDIYQYLDSQNIRLESKGFAMGVRLEHPQHIIDRITYHSKDGRGNYLPPAEYKMATQVNGRGVYSFCMCPGGVIVPSASAAGESLVNGMSASGRSGKWANSGIVVEIRPEDFPDYEGFGALSMLNLQKDLEKRFFEESYSYNAPAQRMKDFINGKKSKDLPSTSFVPGIHTSEIGTLFPPQIGEALKEGLKTFGKKYKGFLTNEAVLIGLESRTSSPVRIPRDPSTLEHTELKGLYPVGEGAGYSGGIVSSAIDGRKAMEAIAAS